MHRLAVLIVLALVAGCSAEPPAASDGPVRTAEPVLRDDEPPRTVLEVFLKSLVIGDCGVTRELTTDPGFLQVGGFCHDIHVVNFVIQDDGVSAGSAAVTFATKLTIEGGGGVLADGDHTIIFSLGRQPTGPWRVTGGGTGP